MKRHHNWTEDIQWTSQLKIIVAKTFWRSIAPFLAKKTNESIRINGKKTTRKKSLSTKISLKKILKFDYNPADLESAYDIPTAFSKQCTAKLVGFCLYFFFLFFFTQNTFCRSRPHQSARYVSRNEFSMLHCQPELRYKRPRLDQWKKPITHHNTH